jgi:hypothetical protein
MFWRKGDGDTKEIKEEKGKRNCKSTYKKKWEKRENCKNDRGRNRARNNNRLHK